MKDSQARYEIETLRAEIKELREKFWRCDTRIRDIHEFLKVEEKEDPRRVYLAPKPKSS